MSVFDGLPDAFVSSLGQTVQLFPDEAVVRSITAIFRRPSESETVFSEQGVITRGTTLHAREVDVTDVKENSSVGVNGTIYRMGPPMPDGRGMVMFNLVERD